MRDDRIVGIVSRADLLRAFAAGTRRSTSGHISERPGVVGEIISAIDARFSHKNAAVAAGETLPTGAETGLTVTDFRTLAADFDHHDVEHQEEDRWSRGGATSTTASRSLSITMSPTKAGARSCIMPARLRSRPAGGAVIALAPALAYLIAIPNRPIRSAELEVAAPS